MKKSTYWWYILLIGVNLLGVIISICKDDFAHWGVYIILCFVIFNNFKLEEVKNKLDKK